MNSYKIDIPVLLIFFVRTEITKKTFEAIRQARPSKLYLYQDGPRPGREDDLKNLIECRDAIEAMIDWDCEVHRFYQEENKGCDPSEFIAQKWMFETEEMGIVIEDDDVASQAFFPYCKELLEKYKDDDRVNMICGMNNFDVADWVEDSYFFAQTGAICGWASWKRVIDTWDGAYSFLDDSYAMEQLSLQERNFPKKLAKTQMHRASKKEYYESILGFSRMLHHRLNIVPKYNMITNIGVGAESTHGHGNIHRYTKRARSVLNKKRYEIDLPLKHPKYMIADKTYENKMNLTFWQKVSEKLEATIRCIIFR